MLIQGTISQEFTRVCNRIIEILDVRSINRMPRTHPPQWSTVPIVVLYHDKLKNLIIDFQKPGLLSLWRTYLERPPENVPGDQIHNRHLKPQMLGISRSVVGPGTHQQRPQTTASNAVEW